MHSCLEIFHAFVLHEKHKFVIRYTAYKFVFVIYVVYKYLSYISKYFTLKTGDLLYTGTPAGVAPVKIGDHLEGYIEDDKVLDFYVR